MATTADSAPESTGKPPKRLWRNFLLDPKFQLKYTGMVVAVTVVIAAALGAKVYQYSIGMSQMLAMERGAGMVLDDAVQRLIEEESAKEDRKVVLSIIGGITILALALGVTGIIVTHRVVGPAFKLKLLLGDVAAGTLNVRGGLRKGDELQEVGAAFKQMVDSLRDQKQSEIDTLSSIIDSASDAGTDPGLVARLRELRTEMGRMVE